MLHTKFQGNRPSVPEKILKGFYLYGHGGHLGHECEPDTKNKISFPPTQGGSI